ARTLTRQAREMPMTATTPGIELLPGGQPRLPTGCWRGDPARPYAVFPARLAAWRGRGPLPLTGGVLIREPVEDSTARLAARASAVSTGSPGLDRLLTGPRLLGGGTFPAIRFPSTP